MKQTLTLWVLLMLFFASCKKTDKFTTNEDPDTQLQPEMVTNAASDYGSLRIKGVKWKNEMYGQDSAKSPRFETGGLTYDDAAKGLADNGVTNVVLKVAELKIMPSGTTVDDIHNEVVKMIGALKRKSVRAYIWQRQWLQKQGQLNGGDEEFASEMKKIIDKAKAAGVDDNIEGIALIENNLENASQILSQALSVAQKINNKTNGWLRTKRFLFPGAAMGGYFKSIHNNSYSAGFFGNMANEVSEFSFIYKHMKSQEIPNCSLGSLNAEWDANVGKNSTKTVAEQVDYINLNMGLANLLTFLDNHVGAHPTLCNVTFWGDSGDGMIQMSRNNILAVNKALVQDKGWKGYFLDMAYCKTTATGGDLTKYILKTNGSTVSKNFSTNNTGFTTVWDEWNQWQWAVTGY